MIDNKIAIVGLGYLSSSGSGKKVFFDKINNGEMTTKIECYDPDEYMAKRGQRYFSDATKMFCNLSFQCINQNQINKTIELNKNSVGLYDGTELSNIHEGFIFDLSAKHDGPDLVSPMSTPNTIANAAASQMAIQSKITGPNFSINGGMCAALQALDVASLHLNDSIIDCAIVGSTETTSKYHQAIREGENRVSNLPQSNEYGLSVALERVETAKENKQEIYGLILGIISGQTYEGQVHENLIATLVEELLINTGLQISEIDMIMIGAGGHNINGTLLEKEIVTTLGQSSKIFFPELIYGNGDNAGGLASVLYTIGLFTNELNEAKGFFDKGTMYKEGLTIKPKNVIVATIDKTGYSVITLLKKYI